MRGLGAVLGAGLLLGLMLGGPPVTWVAPVAPAGARPMHAQVAATFPADGATLDAPPARVSVFLKARPPTLEGDPLRVYGPTGRRVDAGDVAVSRFEGGGSALSVGLSPEGTRSAGGYHVAYRIISPDSHLVVGHISFRTRRPAAASGSGSGSAEAASRSPREPGRESYARPEADEWPRAVFAGGVALGALGAASRRWRRSRREAAVRREAPPRSRSARPPSWSH